LKNKKTPHTAGEIPKKKSYIKIVEWGEIYNLNINIHDRSLSLLDTGTSMKSGGVKLISWAQNIFLIYNDTEKVDLLNTVNVLFYFRLGRQLHISANICDKNRRTTDTHYYMS
jgi:hypothetical protein